MERKSYKEWIEELRAEWIDAEVIYSGARYRVLDVDYNGGLLIDKPAQFTEDTAVPIMDCEKV